MKDLFVAAGFLVLFSYASGQAKDGTAELQKYVAVQPAALIYLPYSPEVVKKALNNYLSKTSDKQQKNAKEFLLSSNTLIVKNNKTEADMHFLIGLRSPGMENESVIYLKLNSSSKVENHPQTPIQFDMQEAKDYLNNLAIAIKPYAKKLQLELQQKNLSNAQNNNTSLVIEGNRLEEQRKKIKAQIGNDDYRQGNRTLARKQANNEKLINENAIARLNSDNDIIRQRAELALLTD